MPVCHHVGSLSCRKRAHGRQGAGRLEAREKAVKDREVRLDMSERQLRLWAEELEEWRVSLFRRFISKQSSASLVYQCPAVHMGTR